MASLADIVNVQISLNTPGVAYATFGTALIASPHASFSELVRTYKRGEYAEDNLPPILVTALDDHFAQTPSPVNVKVGRLSVDKVVIQPSSIVNSAVYSLKVDGQLATYTADASATGAEIATGVAGAITALAISGITATAVSATVEITYASAVKALTDFTRLEFGTITPTAAALAADLTAIEAQDNAWYDLHLTERTPARVLVAAEWVEARKKIFGTALAEADILNPALETDTISVLASTQYFRTYAAYHGAAATEFADVAWASRVLPIQPGGETWALKRLASVSPDNLTSTQKNTVVTKGGNTFEFYQPQLALTNPGKVVAGEWIDVIRFRDWLENFIQVNMVTLMVKRDKVPYTDAGIQLIGNNLKASLRRGQEVGGISPDEFDADGNTIPGFIVTLPLRADVTDAEAASRILNIGFSARLAGAVHVTNVTGNLSYSFN
jgi:hypothetical protein